MHTGLIMCAIIAAVSEEADQMNDGLQIDSFILHDAVQKLLGGGKVDDTKYGEAIKALNEMDLLKPCGGTQWMWTEPTDPNSDGFKMVSHVRAVVNVNRER